MPLTVRVTETFLTALSDIEAFLTETGYSIYYDRLIDTLSQNVIPRLQQFPEIGRNFMERSGVSLDEILYSIQKVDDFSPIDEITGIREYIFEPYVLLYSVSPLRIYLLYLLHQRQNLDALRT